MGEAIVAANIARKKGLEALGAVPVRIPTESYDEWQARITAWQNSRRALEETYNSSVASAVATGDAAYASGTSALSAAGGSASNPYAIGGMGIQFRNAGGMIKGYRSGGTVGRDSVPAMLTPGEFVVRKAMVGKYGIPMLQSINQGSFSDEKMFAGGTPDFDERTGKYRRRSGFKIPSITPPRFNIPKERYRTTPVKGSNQQVVAPMYNNYSVNVSVSNTNASADDIANKTIMKIKQMNDMQIRSGRGY